MFSHSKDPLAGMIADTMQEMQMLVMKQVMCQSVRQSSVGQCSPV